MQKQQVRPKDGWYLAVPVQTPGQMIRLASGHTHIAKAGDYLVQLDGQMIDLCPEKELRVRYDVREEGGLRLSGEAVRAIEDRVGIGAGQSASALLQAVTRLASLKVGEIEIRLTAGQWSELRYRAEKNGRDLAEEVRLVAQRIEDELFHGGVGRGIGGKV